MKIDDGLEILELHNNMNGTVGIYRPMLIWDKDTAILVDTGLPGLFENIREEMEKAGVPFEKLDKVIITHQDIDHIGNLSRIVKESRGNVKVLAHEAERPYIDGEKPLIKMIPERMAEMEERMKTKFSSLSTNVDVLLEDGDEIPVFGGIKVIHTPGHTPGHICLYLKKYKILITGDAMNASDGKLLGPNPVFTPYMEEAVKSLKKLNQYDIQTAICYHGGVVNNNVNKRIAELADTKM